MLLSVLFGLFLNEYLPERRPSSRRTFECHARKLVEDLGDRALDSYTLADIKSWMARASISLAPASVMHRLCFLKMALDWAVEREHLERNPADRVKPLKVRNWRIRYLSEAEEEIIQLRAAPEVFSIIRFAILTGLRRLEIFNIKPGHIDWQQRILLVADSKTGDQRIIPLHPEAYAVLQYWCAVARALGSLIRSDYVFEPHLHPRERWKAAAVWCEGKFRPLVRDCGIQDFRFHDLRHTFATRLVINKTPLYEVQVLLGHKNPLMTQRYAHLAADHLRAAVYRLN